MVSVDTGMSLVDPLGSVRHDDVIANVERALPQVFGYLLHRCGDRALAEDLTADTVLSAIDRVRRGAGQEVVTVAYLIGIARNRLVDHWRREDCERRHSTPQSTQGATFDEYVEPGRVNEVMAALSPMQRAALTLRYVDDLPVTSVATVLGRSVAATETLLVRARRAFRDLYSRSEP